VINTCGNPRSFNIVGDESDDQHYWNANSTNMGKREKAAGAWPTNGTFEIKIRIVYPTLRIA
jgi:hypothetical protein